MKLANLSKTEWALAGLFTVGAFGYTVMTADKPNAPKELPQEFCTSDNGSLYASYDGGQTASRMGRAWVRSGDECVAMQGGGGTPEGYMPYVDKPANIQLLSNNM
ncbi:MAG: hypothetical protein DI551_11415 [Micavibrio aeruginosavorus]|uniref:Uncharacterized protein n=1 Tax=Micavibrio aeruginosavorus TaxID=349221 RepID=A0A2W5MTV0_9BACT|nr:MAG: hypothetical protein DI551_11415 [Micavibrio aeruginosavorus]